MLGFDFIILFTTHAL